MELDVDVDVVGDVDVLGDSDVVGDVNVVGDVDVVVGGADMVVEDIEEEGYGLDGSSLLVLNNEGKFSGEFEAVGAPVEAATIETDLRDPGEDVGDSAVVVAAAAFSAG